MKTYNGIILLYLDMYSFVHVQNWGIPTKERIHKNKLF